MQETSALVLNITGSILSVNDNIFRTTETETPRTHVANSQPAPEQIPLAVTSLIGTTSSDEIRPQSVIECIPYLNQTNIDTLYGIQNRYNLPNKPDPTLIKIFHNNNNKLPNLENIKNRLIKLKSEVITNLFNF